MQASFMSNKGVWVSSVISPHPTRGSDVDRDPERFDLGVFGPAKAAIMFVMLEARPGALREASN
jgi:hypothetical protein